MGTAIKLLAVISFVGSILILYVSQHQNEDLDLGPLGSITLPSITGGQ